MLSAELTLEACEGSCSALAAMQASQLMLLAEILHWLWSGRLRRFPDADRDCSG